MNSLAHKAGLLFLCCLVTAVAQASMEKLAYQEQVITIDGERRVARVPQGYQLELLTGALEGPRLLTFSGNGDLFIGSKSGKVYRLPPPYTAPQVLVTLGDYPHSVAFRTNEVLIARTDGVYRAPYRPDRKSWRPMR